jgi:hypothetical protein
MADDVMFIEASENITPLQAFIREYEARNTSSDMLDVLRTALRLSEGLTGSNVERERIRRNIALPTDDIVRLTGMAEQAGEESYSEQYAMMEVIQAASVANSDLNTRTMCSVKLASAALKKDRVERARQGFADAIVGTRILARFFDVADDKVVSFEESIRANWEARRGEHGVRGLLDAESDEPAREWMEEVLWNSDLGSNEGLTGQPDATIRLAVRLEHWTQTLGRPLFPIAVALRDQWVELSKAYEPAVNARLAVTVADALIELGEWEWAARFHRQGGELRNWDATFPIVVHAAGQAAYCYLMLGELDECRRQLSVLDKGSMEEMAQLVITMAAEFARYQVVDELAKRREGGLPNLRIREHLEPLVRNVAKIVRPRSATRLDYLRTLFFAVLMRDLDAMLGSA